MKLEIEIQDGVGVLTLSHPPYNTLTHPEVADREFLVALLARPDLKGLVVTGAGRHFSAGAAPSEVDRLIHDPDPAPLAAAFQAGKAFLSTLAFAPVPVVAAIRGCCLGGGLEIALAAHFRVASENATLAFPEAGLGLLPGLGGTVLGTEALPRGVLLDLLLSARALGAREALALGLVDRVVPTADVMPAAKALLQDLVGNRPPRVVRAVMQAMHNARRLSRDEALAEETRLFLSLAREAARAAQAET